MAKIIRSIRNVAPSLDDVDLVLAARTDETWAREALFRRHAAAIHGLVFRLLGPYGGVRELVESTFIQGFRQLPQLKDPTAYVPWMFRIAVQAASSRLPQPVWPRWPRRQRRADFAGFRSQLVLAGQEERSKVAAFYECLEILPPKARVALLLRELEGMDAQDIAYVMRAKAPAVRRWSLHAERKLRELGAAARPPLTLLRAAEDLPVPLSEFERTQLYRRVEAGLATRTRTRSWKLGALGAGVVFGVGGAVMAFSAQLPKGARPAAPVSVAPSRVIELPDGSRMSLSPSAELRVDALEREHVRLTLVSGRADFELGSPASRFVVGAGDAQITAVGRRLSIAILPAKSSREPASLEVRATEGPVDVQRGAGAPITLGTGESWSARLTVPSTHG